MNSEFFTNLEQIVFRDDLPSPPSHWHRQAGNPEHGRGAYGRVIWTGYSTRPRPDCNTIWYRPTENNRKSARTSNIMTWSSSRASASWDQTTLCPDCSETRYGPSLLPRGN